MQLAMSVYYNQDVTKREKRIRNIRTSSQLSGSTPPNGGLHPELATIVDRRGTSAENAQKGDSPGDIPSAHQDLALSAKVTTGGLSAPSPGGRRGATSYGLMGPGASHPGSTS
jgi:hypothetical protein